MMVNLLIVVGKNLRLRRKWTKYPILPKKRKYVQHVNVFSVSVENAKENKMDIDPNKDYKGLSAKDRLDMVKQALPFLDKEKDLNVIVGLARVIHLRLYRNFLPLKDWVVISSTWDEVQEWYDYQVDTFDSREATKEFIENNYEMHFNQVRYKGDIIPVEVNLTVEVILGDS